MDCELAGICSGCPRIGIPRGEQWHQGLSRLKAFWQEAGLSLKGMPEPIFVDLGDGGLRDRVDLTLQIEHGRLCLGLYDTERRFIADMNICPQMSPALAAWHNDFRQMLPPVTFGHLRLRVAPDGRRGVWLDFSRADQAALLADGGWLTAIHQCAHVEIGQRRQTPRLKNGAWQLGPPECLPWFETYLPHAAALFGQIAGFSQVGFRANQVLVQTVRELWEDSPQGDWLELGCGNGNFTLPLAASGRRVIGLEQDPRALKGLHLAAEQLGFSESIETRTVNFFQKNNQTLAEMLVGIDGVLADPPRSGLGNFLELFCALEQQTRPTSFIYVSCFGESFSKDSARLIKAGYQLVRLNVLDLFPQTDHFEYAALFQG